MAKKTPIKFIDGIVQMGVALYNKQALKNAQKTARDNLREEMGDEIYRNFQRNQTLIDFDYIPEEIQNTIINTFNETKPAPNMKVLNYLVKNRLKNLIECTEEFYTHG